MLSAYWRNATGAPKRFYLVGSDVEGSEAEEVDMFGNVISYSHPKRRVVESSQEAEEEEEEEENTGESELATEESAAEESEDDEGEEGMADAFAAFGSRRRCVVQVWLGPQEQETFTCADFRMWRRKPGRTIILRVGRVHYVQRKEKIDDEGTKLYLQFTLGKIGADPLVAIKTVQARWTSIRPIWALTEASEPLELTTKQNKYYASVAFA
jgi:hypothetical protein